MGATVAGVEGVQVSRVLIEVQVSAMIDQPGRLYDLLHALVEECYRRADQRSDPRWRRLAMCLTLAERITQNIT